MGSKPTVALALPHRIYLQMFAAEDLGRLAQAAEIVGPAEGDGAARLLGSATAAITGWGSPRFDARVLAGSNGLKLIAHSAGSVKGIVTDAVYDRGIHVTTAAGENAVPVAQFTVAMMVSLLKQVPWTSAAMARNDSETLRQRRALARELQDMTVGIVGCSRIGRLVIGLLKAYEGIRIKVYDPYLSADAARDLNVTAATLEEVCHCEVVSIHAPNTAETRHMINARTLALLPDHAVLINTARGALIDEAALIAELHRRPLYVALDVTDPEPPPAGSHLRSEPNIILTPHIAGAQHQAKHRMGRTAIDEALRFLRGEPLHSEVTRAMLATQA